MSYLIQGYDKAYAFPSDDVPFEAKVSDGYNLAYSQAMYSAYVRGFTGITYNDSLKFQMLRAFSNGQQPESRYLDRLYPIVRDKHGNAQRNASGEFVRKGFMNLNFEIFSPADKLRDKIVGMYTGINKSLSVTAVDELSGSEREDMKWKVWFKKVYAKELAAINEMMGVKPMETGNDISVDSLDELDMFQSMGAFKLRRETMIKEGCRGAFYESQWQDEIEKKLIEDLIAFNTCFTQDYTDPITQRAKVKYLDPAKVIVPYVRDHNFNNIIRWGHMEEWTIADLRMVTDIPEEELRKIAETNVNRYGNGVFDGSAYTANGTAWEGNLGSSVAYYGYDRFKCIVLFTENYSIDTVDGKKSKNVYKRNWIVGTKHVFDCGQQYDIPFPESDNEPRLSLHGFRLAGRSITERCIPLYDSIQMGWLKYQNAKAKAKPKGTAYNVSFLESSTQNGEKNDPRDVMLMHSHTGDYLYRDKVVLGQGVSLQLQGKPFYETEGGMGLVMQEWITSFDKDMSILLDFAGLTDSAASGTVNPNTPVETQKLAAIASSHILKPLYLGFTNVMQNTAINLAARITNIIKYSKKSYKAYYNIFGKAGMQVFQISPDVCDSKYGIQIVVAPDDRMRAEINEAAKQSMMAGKSGKEGITGITWSDWLIIQRFLEGDNIDLAAWYFMKKEQQRKAEGQKVLNDNQKISGEIAQQTQQAKDQAEIVKNEQATENAIKIEYWKNYFENFFKSQEALAEFQRETSHKILDMALASAQPAQPAQ